MPVTKLCVSWKDLGLLVRIISKKDLLSDIKQVGSLTRFFDLKTSNLLDQINGLKRPHLDLLNQYQDHQQVLYYNFSKLYRACLKFRWRTLLYWNLGDEGRGVYKENTPFSYNLTVRTSSAQDYHLTNRTGFPLNFPEFSRETKVFPQVHLYKHTK